MIAVHGVLGWISTFHYIRPMNDVTTVYRGWIDDAIAGSIPGIHENFVYPVGSLVPMWLADLFGGHDRYTTAWVVIVLVLNLWALWWLTLRRKDAADARLRRRAAWFWVAFTALLGPIALGRIDAITVPLAIVGLLSLRERPALAGALFTAGAWLKVWPAALFAAAFVAIRQRWLLVGGAVMVCAMVFVGVLALGGTAAIPHTLSFITEQADRGLQLESTAASVFLMFRVLGAGGYTVAFDRTILTQQIAGPGTEFVGDLLTPAMFLVVLLLLALSWWAQRRGVDLATRLPMLALGLVTAFIVVNKVGSPQFIVWLAPVMVFGLVWSGRRFEVVAIVSLLIAALTQLIYPWYYWQIADALPAGAVLLLARNLLLVGLLIWAILRLVRPRADRRTTRAIRAARAD